MHIFYIQVKSWVLMFLSLYFHPGVALDDFEERPALRYPVFGPLVRAQPKLQHRKRGLDALMVGGGV